MILSFLLTLLCLLVPVFAMVYLDGKKNLRATALSYLPLAAILHFGFFGITAGVFNRLLPYGWGKCALLTLVSAGLTYLSLRIARANGILVLRHRFQTKAVLLAAGLAGLLLFDVGWIFAKNGWSFDDALGLRNHLTYFRPPLNVDGFRHVTIVNALIRQEGSPFLPGTAFAYQLFWFQIAAVFVSLTEGVSNFSAVCGTILGTGYIFTFSLLAILLSLRPALLLRTWPVVCLSFILFLHADLQNAIGALISEGRLGIPVDGSFHSIAFNPFSLKLALLTAPQHIAFLFFALLFLWVRNSPLWAVKFVPFALGFLVSPIHSLFFFPPLWVIDAVMARRRPTIRQALLWICCLGILLCLYSVIWKVTVYSLFVRPVLGRLLLFSPVKWELFLFPFALVGVAGVLGLLASFVILKRWRKVRAGLIPELVFLVSGVPIYHYVFSDLEMQRHYSILSCLVMAFLIVRALPAFRALARTRFWPATLGTLAVSSVVLSGYFVYCYVGKPGALPPTFAYEDYFLTNRYIRDRYPGQPVLGATDIQRGLIFPPAIEAATSYAGPLAVVIHSRLDRRQMAGLQEAQRIGIVPFAASFGYQLVTWGPIEDWVWGEKSLKTLIGNGTPLHEQGAVRLYRIAKP